MVKLGGIGGYFGLDQLVDNEYHKGLLALNTGRNALLYLLRARGISKLYIPYYLCHSVSGMLQQHKFDFEYYHISADFNPEFYGQLGKNDYLYIVNFYGQLTNDRIARLRAKYERIIVDNTHAFFQKPVAGLDTIYSCRKFFGVPDGAYLSTDSVLEENLQIDVSKDRMVHILGRFEGSASDYYSYFRENDVSFKSMPLRYMSKLTRNILGAIDYERGKGVRNRNYAYLDSKLGGLNGLRLTVPEGAFAYPLYLENGAQIRKLLVERKVYVPILWPNVLKDRPIGSIEYEYAANILPLPCDQRYGLDEMGYIAGVMCKCMS